MLSCLLLAQREVRCTCPQQVSRSFSTLEATVEDVDEDSATVPHESFAPLDFVGSRKMLVRFFFAVARSPMRKKLCAVLRLS